MANIMKLAKALMKHSSRKYVIILVLAISLRAIPELLSGIYPIGFDAVVGYAPSIMAFPDNSPMKVFGWAWSPLAIDLLWVFKTLTNLDVYLLLKIAGPIFYGLLGVSFCYLLSNGLRWNDKKSLIVALIFVLLPPVLRTGWDQLREQLGLIFFFILLGYTKCDLVKGARTKPVLAILLSLLIVFSHQLVAVLLFVVVSYQIVIEVSRKNKDLFPLLLLILPSLAVFVWQLHGQFLNPSFNPHFVPIRLDDGIDNFAFTNYFLSDPRFIGGTYSSILGYVGSLSIYTVVPLIPFAIKGFSKDKVFTPMLIWLSIASFSILIFPWSAIAQYWWWMFLLPIPLVVYVGESLERIHVFNGKHRRKLLIGISILGVIAMGYATSSIPLGYPFAFSYMPSGMVESAVPFGDIADIISAYQWLSRNSPPDSTVVVEERTMGFAYTELRSDMFIRVSPSLIQLNDVVSLIHSASERTYAVWYTQNIDFESFDQPKIAEFGSIAIFELT
jgi:hypothetical protein